MKNKIKITALLGILLFAVTSVSAQTEVNRIESLNTPNDLSSLVLNNNNEVIGFGEVNSGPYAPYWDLTDYTYQGQISGVNANYPYVDSAVGDSRFYATTNETTEAWNLSDNSPLLGSGTVIDQYADYGVETYSFAVGSDYIYYGTYDNETSNGFIRDRSDFSKVGYLKNADIVNDFHTNDLAIRNNLLVGTATDDFYRKIAYNMSGYTGGSISISTEGDYTDTTIISTSVTLSDDIVYYAGRKENENTPIIQAYYSNNLTLATEISDTITQYGDNVTAVDYSNGYLVAGFENGNITYFQESNIPQVDRYSTDSTTSITDIRIEDNYTYVTSNGNVDVYPVANRKPSITGVKYYLNETTGVEQIKLSVDDFGEGDIDTASGPGTLDSVSNSEVVFNVSLPVEGSYTVSDTNGLTSTSRTVNLSMTESTNSTEFFGAGGDFDLQTMKTDTFLNNSDSGSVDYNIVQEYVLNGVKAEGVFNSSIGSFGDFESQSYWPYEGSVSGNTNKQLNSDSNGVWTADFIVSERYNNESTGETSGFSHTLDTQSITTQQSLAAENLADVVFVDLTVQNYCKYDIGTEFNVGTGNNTKIQDCRELSSENDWIVGETVGNYSKTENSSYSHSLDSQEFIATENLTVNNTKDFSFTGVDISSKCSIDTSKDVPSGVNEITTSCNNETYNGDFLSETLGDVNVPDTVTLGLTYSADRGLTVENNLGFQFSSVDTTTLTTPNSCTRTNNTIVNVLGNTNNSFSLGFDCNPGNKGTPSQTITDVDSGTERIWYNSTDMSIASNLTENSTIRILVSKDPLKNPADREGDSLYSIVETQSSKNYSELSIDDQPSFFRINVGTAFQSSSLHTDDSDWSLTYTLDTGNGGTGGSGGTGSPGTDETTVYFGSQSVQEQEFSAPTGTNVERQLSITNTQRQEITAQLNKAGGDACEYIKLEKGIDSNEYGDSGSYQLPEAVETLGSVEKTVNVGVQISLPPTEDIQEFEDLSCEFTTRASYGQAEHLTMVINEQDNFLVVAVETVIDFFKETGDELTTTLGFDPFGSFTVPCAEINEINGEAQAGSCEPTEVPTTPFTLGGLLLVVYLGLRLKGGGSATRGVSDLYSL